MSCASVPFTAESTVEFRNKCSCGALGSAWFQIGIPWCNRTTKPESVRAGALFFCCAFLWFQGKQNLGHPYFSPRRSEHLLLMDKHATLYMSCFVQTTDTPPRKAGPNVCGACGRVGSARGQKFVWRPWFFSQEGSLNYIYVVSLTSPLIWHFTKVVLSINRVCLVRP